MTNWFSEDAQRARRKLVRKAVTVLVPVQGKYGTFYVKTSKLEALRLLDKAQFVVHSDGVVASLEAFRD